MVKVLTLTAEEGSEYLAPSPLTSGPLVELAGLRQGPVWTPPPVDLVTSEDKRQRRSVDCPFLMGGLLAVKDAALVHVRPVLEAYSEFLPLDCPQVEVTAANVLQILHVLDEERSDFARSSSGRIMLVERYAFRAKTLPAEECSGSRSSPEQRSSSPRQQPSSCNRS